MIFFGTKRVQRELPPEQKVCPTCLSVTEHTVIDFDTRFTLYLIPLFSLKREVVYRCTRCGDYHAIPYEEYEARHRPAEPVAAEADERVGPRTTPGEKAKPTSARDKARLILEGRVVNGRVKDLRLPFAVTITSRHLVIGLWIAFAVILLAAALLLFIVFSIMAR